MNKKLKYIEKSFLIKVIVIVALSISNGCAYLTEEPETGIAIPLREEKSYEALAKEHLRKGIDFIDKEERDKNSLMSAAQEFAEAIFFNPQLEAAHLNLGLTYYHLNEEKLAIKRFEYMAKHFSGSMRGNALYNLGVIYNDINDLDKALAYFSEAKKEDMPEAWPAMAYIFKAQGMYSKAERELKDYLSYNPKRTEIYLQLGALYMDRGEYYYEKARDIFLEALKSINDDPRIYSNLGIIYYKEGNLNSSIIKFKKAVSLMPDSGSLNYNLGKVFYDKGNMEGALKYFKRASIYGHIDALFAIVRIYEKQGKFKRALNTIEKMIADGYETARVYAEKGIILHNMKDYDKAEKAYIKSTKKLNKWDSTIYTNLAVLYSDTGRFDKALALYKKIIEKEPDFYIVHKNIAILYDLYVNKPEKADYHYKRYLKKADISAEEKRVVRKWIREIKRRRKESQEL